MSAIRKKVTFQEAGFSGQPQAMSVSLGGDGVYDAEGGFVRPNRGMGGGGYEGASRFDREVASWRPSMGSPDRIINWNKELLDARGRDSVRNNGYVSGAAKVHQDSIVGAQYRLNATPNYTLLSKYNKGYNKDWATKFSAWAEAWFNTTADSPECWLDATRSMTLTAMLRLVIAVFMQTGETIATAEWVNEATRPFKTAIQFVRSDRLCNPQGVIDTRTLRRGVKMDLRGKPISYYFRMGEKFDPYPDDYAWRWREVAARKPWGRRQVIHIIEASDHGQTRGIADMVSILKSLRMTSKFRDVVLQSAVINATYAAAIESELPGEAIAAAMGAGNANGPIPGMIDAYGGYMSALTAFLGGAQNIGIDGAKVPHLFPGTKMNIRNTGTPGGIGTSFDDAMLRHIAAGLGVSYESLSRDFSKTNYSSGRLAMNVQNQAMASRKRHVADRTASEIYQLWLEEQFGLGNVPLPKGGSKEDFYEPLAKEAFSRCSWIGSGAGQTDELKESQAAILRIRSGLSTHAIESARLGNDWREIVVQRADEIVAFGENNVPADYISQKPMDKPTDVPQDAPTDDSANEADGETDESGNPDNPAPSKGQSS